MLIKGSTAMKYGRQGRPHPTIFKLSPSEDALMWEGKKTLAYKLQNKPRLRSINLADALDVLVGHESAVFRRYAGTAGAHAHLSLSLLLLSAATDYDEADGDPAPSAGVAKETLDLSFDDDETFGYWYAAQPSPSSTCPAHPLTAASTRERASHAGVFEGARASALSRRATAIGRSLLTRAASSLARLRQGRRAARPPRRERCARGGGGARAQ